MPWIIFTIISAAVITVAAMQLAKYGDVIAIRTRLGGMFIGLILLAGVTSLPELLTSINSIQHNEPNLAAGNLLGSCMFNIVLAGCAGPGAPQAAHFAQSRPQALAFGQPGHLHDRAGGVL
jgi:Ca2+/Na+ antiporter